MSTDTSRGTFEHFGFGVPWEDTGNYSQGVLAGNLLFIAGQLAHDPEGNLLGEGDFAVQADGALANVGLVLGAFGAERSDIVEMTVYVVELRRNFDAALAAGRNYLGSHRPAVTVIGVEALAFPSQLIEISAKAVLRRTRD